MTNTNTTPATPAQGVNDTPAARFADAFTESTQGKWTKGLTTHHTVREQDGYRIGEFHHANDAHFCDVAHELAPAIIKALERADAVEAATPKATCGLCGSDRAFSGTCGGGQDNPQALCYRKSYPSEVVALIAPAAIPKAKGDVDAERVQTPGVEAHGRDGKQPPALPPEGWCSLERHAIHALLWGELQRERAATYTPAGEPNNAALQHQYRLGCISGLRRASDLAAGGHRYACYDESYNYVDVPASSSAPLVADAEAFEQFMSEPVAAGDDPALWVSPAARQIALRAFNAGRASVER